MKKLSPLVLLLLLSFITSASAGLKTYVRIGDAPETANLYENKETGGYVDVNSLPRGYRTRITKNEDIFKKVDLSTIPKEYRDDYKNPKSNDIGVNRFNEEFEKVEKGTVKKNTIELDFGIVVYSEPQYAPESSELYKVEIKELVKLEENKVKSRPLIYSHFFGRYVYLDAGGIREKPATYKKIKLISVGFIKKVSRRDKQDLMKKLTTKTNQLLVSKKVNILKKKYWKMSGTMRVNRGRIVIKGNGKTSVSLFKAKLPKEFQLNITFKGNLRTRFSANGKIYVIYTMWKDTPISFVDLRIGAKNKGGILSKVVDGTSGKTGAPWTGVNEIVIRYTDNVFTVSKHNKVIMTWPNEEPGEVVTMQLESKYLTATISEFSLIGL